jgi:hypothetical protein
VNSPSEEADVDIEVRRRGHEYILLARQFGVVVRSKELQYGIEELERRVTIVGQNFREAGIMVRSVLSAEAENESSFFKGLAPYTIMIVTVAAIVATLVILTVAPIVVAIASVRSEISSLVPAESGGGIAGIGHLGIDFIIKVSQTIEQVTPERKEQLRAAIHNIAREVNMVVEDVGTAPAPSAPPPSSGDKR